VYPAGRAGFFLADFPRGDGDRNVFTIEHTAGNMPESNTQRETCLKFGTSYLLSDERLKVGITRIIDRKQFPINGPHPPEGDTTGWYIWSGEEFPTAGDAFVPLCAFHLNDQCPEIVKYLGMGPGWRFLVAPGYEDVWYDANLLDLSK
jgi:hypothetical protein